MPRNPEQLEFVSVDVDGAVLFQHSGVVDTEEVVHLPSLEPHAVRVFRRHLELGPRKQGLLYGSLVQMVDLVPTVLRGYIKNIGAVEIRRMHHYVVASKGRVERLNAPEQSSIREIMGLWHQSSDTSDVLMEVTASQPELVKLVAHLQSEPTVNTVAAHTAVVPQETDGAANRRAELMSGWLDSAAIADAIGSAAENKAQYAAALRKRGKLLGVWVPSEKAFRHPSCQIHQGELLPVMHDLLQVLPKGTGSGWAQAEWLYSPHALLDKRTPADLLVSEPDRVLAAAKREYQEEVHARW